LELARLISRLHDLPPSCYAIDLGLPPNRYTSDPRPYLHALRSQGILPRSLEEQIVDTAIGLKVLQGPRCTPTR
jgi:hypothetical protein